MGFWDDNDSSSVVLTIFGIRGRLNWMEIGSLSSEGNEIGIIEARGLINSNVLPIPRSKIRVMPRKRVLGVGIARRRDEGMIM